METTIIIFLLFVIVILVTQTFKLKKEIKEHHLFENELLYEAEHDVLTGLANGLLFIDRLKQSIKNARRYKKKIAILYLGLDNFKDINETHSSNVGDFVLKEMATRLKQTLRDSDTVARLGGDEFIIMLDHFEDGVYIRSVIDKVMNISKKPFRINENKLNVTFSLGVSIYPDDNLDATRILENASFAMHKVKKTTRDDYQFYTNEFAEEAVKRKKLEKELLKSLENNQMEVYYQLQVQANDASSSEEVSVAGMEALLRWNHPVLGLLLPSEFISLAEEIDFIHELEDWVLKTSVAQFQEWHEQELNTGDLALNLSPQRLKRAGFMQHIGELINKNSSMKDYLQIEVGENQIMKTPEAYVVNLQKLSRLGIKLGIDKFGSGTSSITTLESLELSVLKIDLSIVKDIEHNPAIAKTLISIAKNLNIQICATGVENSKQRDLLQENGCTLMQGSFYHKPAAASVIHKILTSKVKK